MIKTDENALICDFAETYHIFDYRQMRVGLAATYAAGLPDSSRIKKKLSGVRYDVDTLLRALIADRLALLLWTKTKDGQKNRNRPASIYEKFVSEQGDREEYRTFASIDEYEAARAKIMRG